MTQLPNGQGLRPNASPIHGRMSWPSPLGHGLLDTSANLPTQLPHESSIDPQLRNDPVYSSTTLPPAQLLYPLASPPDHVARSSQLSHSRNESVQLSSTENMPRSLPSQNVTDENFDDAYVSFIFYCNPSILSDTDTLELKKAFRSPPKSDGKNFSTFILFELIRKLELKEIKTWAQLAIDLGVEPPAIEKGQSAQKVQQYAVRLKVRITYY